MGVSVVWLQSQCNFLNELTRMNTSIFISNMSVQFFAHCHFFYRVYESGTTPLILII